VIEAGQKATDFTLLDQDGRPRTLSDHHGGPVVLSALSALAATT